MKLIGIKHIALAHNLFCLFSDLLLMLNYKVVFQFHFLFLLWGLPSLLKSNGLNGVRFEKVQRQSWIFLLIFDSQIWGECKIICRLSPANFNKKVKNLAVLLLYLLWPKSLAKILKALWSGVTILLGNTRLWEWRFCSNDSLVTCIWHI